MKEDLDLEREAAEVAARLDRGRGFYREIRGAVAIPLQRKNFVLMPAACIHWPVTDTSLLSEWVSRVKDRKAYVFLLGDSMDFARSHFRRHLRSYNDDPSSMSAVDVAQEKDIKDLAKVLMPIKNQILGVVRGNHYHLFPDGTDSEQKLCQALGTKYLGVEAGIRLDFGRGESLVIYLHHYGGGGGSTAGGDLNGLIKSGAVLNPDITIAAHTHRAYAVKVPQHEIARSGLPVVLSRDRVYARAGCFRSHSESVANSSQAYVPEYRAEAGYTPVQDGWVEIEVEFRKNGRRLWIRS